MSSWGFHLTFVVYKSNMFPARFSRTDAVTGVYSLLSPCNIFNIPAYSISFQGAILHTLQHNYIIVLSYNPARTHTHRHCCLSICLFNVGLISAGARFRIEFCASPRDSFHQTIYSSVYTHKRLAKGSVYYNDKTLKYRSEHQPLFLCSLKSLSCVMT